MSVVMSVYNGADRLASTLDSVLAQEEVDFEFIVINDGSIDESGRILDEYAARDRRIRVVHQENTGLTQALVTGCSMARGEFIARQDAGGDRSLPCRFRCSSSFASAAPAMTPGRCVCLRPARHRP